jgi:molybdopterin-binding protein
MGPIAHVQVNVEGVALVAAVTSATAESLALRNGTQVMVALKATAVHLL